jgi:hypothetical protein
MLLGMVLGAIAGAGVGTQYGPRDEYGPLAGMMVGLFYGWTTGWGFSRARSSLPGCLPADVLCAAILLLGVGAVTVSAAALALIGDTHRFWSAPLPLFGVPFLLLMLVCLFELRLIEAERRAPEKRKPGPIDVSDPHGQGLFYLHRKTWFFVLLPAIADKAREVRLEPGKEGAILSCPGGPPTMAPLEVPPDIVPGLVAEMKRMAQVAKRGPLKQGRLHLRIGDVLLEIAVAIEPTEWGQRVVLRIPEHPLTPEQIEPILRKFVPREFLPGDNPPLPTGINHVCQGEGNCCLASVAMLGGVSYHEVEANCGKFGAQLGGRAWIRALLALLKQFTGKKWKVVPLLSLPSQLDRAPFPDWPMVVCIRPAWPAIPPWSHCIIVKGEHVHDPNLSQAVRMDEYEKGDWHLVLVLTPARARR